MFTDNVQLCTPKITEITLKYLLSLTTTIAFRYPHAFCCNYFARFHFC